MTDSLSRHLTEIDRLNQRGGRMLSVADLLEAKTMPADLAAYLLAAIGGGASFMVGANPGGAGKTTVMGALLNFVPAGIELKPVPGLEAVSEGLSRRAPRCCYICHEIRNSGIYAYLWGKTLREYFRLPEAGHMLATNLHADTIEEARDQILNENGVPAPAFGRMNLALFLRVGVGTRVVESVWETAGGEEEHRRIYAAGRLDAASLKLASRSQRQDARRTLDDLAAGGLRTVGDVRKFLLESYLKKT